LPIRAALANFWGGVLTIAFVVRHIQRKVSRMERSCTSGPGLSNRGAESVWALRDETYGLKTPANGVPPERTRIASLVHCAVPTSASPWTEVEERRHRGNRTRRRAIIRQRAPAPSAV
jgi:hypothetical protein